MALKAGDIAVAVPGQDGRYTLMPYVRPKAGDVACLSVGQDNRSAPFAVVNPKTGYAAMLATGQDAYSVPVSAGAALPCSLAVSNGIETPRGVRLTFHLANISGAYPYTYTRTGESKQVTLYQSSDFPCIYMPRGLPFRSNYTTVGAISYERYVGWDQPWTDYWFAFEDMLPLFDAKFSFGVAWTGRGGANNSRQSYYSYAGSAPAELVNFSTFKDGLTGDDSAIPRLDAGFVPSVAFFGSSGRIRTHYAYEYSGSQVLGVEYLGESAYTQTISGWRGPGISLALNNPTIPSPGSWMTTDISNTFSSDLFNDVTRTAVAFGAYMEVDYEWF